MLQRYVTLKEILQINMDEANSNITWNQETRVQQVHSELMINGQNQMEIKESNLYHKQPSSNTHLKEI